MLIGRLIPPAIRVVIGLVVLVVGLILHAKVAAILGGAVVVIAGGQWLYRRSSGGEQ
jgi:hypothetical protein